MKAGKLTNQNVIASALVSLFLAVLASFAFSAVDFIHYYFFFSIVLFALLAINVMIPLLVQEAVQSYLYRRKGLRIPLPAKFAISLAIALSAAALLRLGNEQGMATLGGILKTSYHYSGMTALVALLFRALRGKENYCAR